MVTSALCLIVKILNGYISTSKNYRGIAFSSLILKVLDKCLLMLFGHPISIHRFQKRCFTIQCTWAVQETISCYLRRGSKVFCCLLDFSKAFDKVNFNELFRNLRTRKLTAIVLRLLIFICRNQSCYIRWNSKTSKTFTVNNKVYQGAILSPSLFCMYLDTLLGLFRDAGVGCLGVPWCLWLCGRCYPSCPLQGGIAKNARNL